MFKGKVWKYGDNVDTDVIIPARYLNTTKAEELAKHCMEDIDSGFASSVQSGDIMVGGWNFGCGSSREHAPIAIQASGISCGVRMASRPVAIRRARIMDERVCPASLHVHSHRARVTTINAGFRMRAGTGIYDKQPKRISNRRNLRRENEYDKIGFLF